MSELIRREDAINAVEMFFEDAYIEDAEVHDLVYKINHIPAASPWHRVEEELPDDSRVVLIFTASRIVGVGSFIRPNWYQWYSSGGLPVDVTYWMPLPEPPKEEA